MTTKSNEYKKLNSCGPGGRNCSCCFPQSGNPLRAKIKKAENKIVRQAEKRKMFSDLMQNS